MVTTQEKQKYCNILKVGLNASQEEIVKAYKKMALKYHPDRNHGKEEWAKKEFIKVGEAYAVLSGKQESGSSNKFSSNDTNDKFKEFEEMLRKVERDLDEQERRFNEYKERDRQGAEKTRSEAIRSIEENLTSSNVSISELDSSLWSPYSDWKEKLENSVSSDLYAFIGDMKSAINKIKFEKINDRQGNYNYNNYSGQGSQHYSPYQGGNYNNYDNPPPSNFYEKNFSSYYNSGQTGEKKPTLNLSDRIEKLEKEISWNRECLSKISNQSEKQRCQKEIDKLEKDLRALQSKNNSKQPSFNSPSGEGLSSDKDEKIKQKIAEIEQLKKNKTWNPFQRGEKDKRITEAEQELSELLESNSENNNDYDDWSREDFVNEVERLKAENKTDDLSKKFSEMEKVMRQLVEEIKELKAEIKELKEQKERGNFSEYQDYLLGKQESQLRNKEQKLEQIKNILNSNSNSNSNFPTKWVVGGGIFLVVGLIALLIVRKIRNKKNKKVLAKPNK
jgi:curved DNA-binding protein CbpA